MVYLALSYDHRLVDGADAARFLGTMKARLEDAAFEAELGLRRPAGLDGASQIEVARRATEKATLIARSLLINPANPPGPCVRTRE
jgi:hypothetical protein